MYDYPGIVFGHHLRFDPEPDALVGDPRVSHDSVANLSRERFVDLVKNTYRVLLYKNTLAMQHQMGINEGLVDCPLGLALIAEDARLAERAVRLLGASDVLSEAMNQAVPPIDRAAYERTVAAIQDSLDPEEYALGRRQGAR